MELDDQQLKEFIREYITNNLEVTVRVSEPDWMNSSYNVSVDIKLDDQTISSSEDWFTIDKES